MTRSDASPKGSPSLNESPSQKEGKFRLFAANLSTTATLNESPSQKEGKSLSVVGRGSD